MSEHSETLVELDVQYAKLAREHVVPGYERVSTVGTATAFMDGLVKVVRMAVAADQTPCSDVGHRICGGEWKHCPSQAVGVA